MARSDWGRLTILATGLGMLLACAGPSVAVAKEKEQRIPLVLLVRHAEKAAEPADDPPLTDAGVQRSEALAAALRDAGVTAIITSQLRRTHETAKPLAAARGLVPEVVQIGGGSVDEHAAAVALAVRRHRGGAVLVVGHSNTIPAIIAALGGPRLPDICESAFGNLFVLAEDSGKVRLVRSHYGANDPPSSPDCR